MNTPLYSISCLVRLVFGPHSDQSRKANQDELVLRLGMAKSSQACLGMFTTCHVPPFHMPPFLYPLGVPQGHKVNPHKSEPYTEGKQTGGDKYYGTCRMDRQSERKPTRAPLSIHRTSQYHIQALQSHLISSPDAVNLISLGNLIYVLPSAIAVGLAIRRACAPHVSGHIACCHTCMSFHLLSVRNGSLLICIDI